MLNQLIDKRNKSRNTFIGRQCIFDDSLQVIGYEMLYRNSMVNSFPIDVSDKEATSYMIDSYVQDGLKISNNRLCFINFDYRSLIDDLPAVMANEKVIIEVLESCKPNEKLLSTLKCLFGRGYNLALDDFNFDSKWVPFLPYISIIKVCLHQVDIHDLAVQRSVKYLQGKGVCLLAEKIETKDEMELCKKLNFTYFQGYYLAKPEVINTMVSNADNRHKTLENNYFNQPHQSLTLSPR